MIFDQLSIAPPDTTDTQRLGKDLLALAPNIKIFGFDPLRVHNAISITLPGASSET